MGARSKARKRALDVLYEAGQRDRDPVQTLRERLAQSDPPVPEYAVTLVEGVVAHRERIDELLATYAEEWTLERMPPVDLAVLRIGVYELAYSPDVPAAVAGDEAIELAKSLSTDNSPRFINGVLGQILTIAPQLRRV